MKGWVDLVATQWFWTRDPWIGNTASSPLELTLTIEWYMSYNIYLKLILLLPRNLVAMDGNIFHMPSHFFSVIIWSMSPQSFDLENI